MPKEGEGTVYVHVDKAAYCAMVVIIQMVGGRPWWGPDDQQTLCSHNICMQPLAVSLAMLEV